MTLLSSVTSRGRVLLGLGAGLLITGRVLALREFLMVGVAILAVLIVGIISVWGRRGRCEAQRVLYPPKSPAGAEIAVELRIRAGGAFGSGPTLLSDRLPESFGGGVRLTVEGMHPGHRERSIRYRIRPELRGRYEIGPLDATATDPFGAAQRTTQAASRSSLIVYPRYERVRSMPAGAQQLGTVRRSPLVGHGDEFYSLRAYEDGEDLRRVHWPSSLRLGELMVRQDEVTGEPHALIVLDTCAAKHRGEGANASLEAAISACASVGLLALRRRMRLDVIGPDGPILRSARAGDEEFLEALALLTPSRHDDLTAILKTLELRRARAAAAIVITPDLSREEIGGLGRIVRRAMGGALVQVDADSFDQRHRGHTAAPAGIPLGVPVVPLRSGDTFAHAWEMGVKDVALAR